MSEERRDEFAAAAPIGTICRYYPIKGRPEFETRTIRSEPWVVGGGEVIVKISGRAGGVSIDHIEVIATPAVRGHPDYAEGYEAAFCQEPPKPAASAEYRAGYEAAQVFVDALQTAGMHAMAPAAFSMSMTIGPMGHIGFDLVKKP
jgi:hypothetical protein